LNNTRYFQPLINGYSGFEPPNYAGRAQQLQTFPSSEALATLRALGVTHVTAFEQRSGAVALDAVARQTALHLVADEGGIRLYQLR